MTTLTKDKATEFIKSLHDKIFGCTFIKKNGEERIMSARLNVSKHANGGGLSYDPEEHNLIGVYDMNNGYRMINVEGLTEIRVDGKVLEVEG